MAHAMIGEDSQPNPGYRRRIVDDELDELFDGGAVAIALEGPKGVGKTATARRRAKTIRNLDDERQQPTASGDARLLLKGAPPVLLDEWQHVPQVWDLVRRAVDDDPSPGRFLLAGSASPSTPPVHSGAGRILSVRMRPLSLAERLAPSRPAVGLRELLTGERHAISGETDIRLWHYAQEIVRSGLPGLRHLDDRVLRGHLDGYLREIVDKDFRSAGHRLRNPAALRRWMTAYAAASSTTASFEKIRDAATGGADDKPARTTVQPFRDTLERMWILDPVEAWMPTRNRIARLSGPPKHQLADPALAARLLGVSAETLIDGRAPDPLVPRDGRLLGALFESLVTQSVRVYAQQAEARVGHMRTRGGTREVDLIVERADGRVVALEVKLADTTRDHDVRHLHWLREQLGDDLLDSVIITTGQFAFRRDDGIAVVPAAMLGP